MKPHRIRMTHDLLVNYDIYKKMEIYVKNMNTQPIPIYYTTHPPNLYSPPFNYRGPSKPASRR